MATAQSDKLEQLRQAVLGNARGREVEVDPTGEIRIADEAGDGKGAPRPIKPSKMSPHTFGA